MIRIPRREGQEGAGEAEGSTEMMEVEREREGDKRERERDRDTGRDGETQVHGAQRSSTWPRSTETHLGHTQRWDRPGAASTQ